MTSINRIYTQKDWQGKYTDNLPPNEIKAKGGRTYQVIKTQNLKSCNASCFQRVLAGILTVIATLGLALISKKVRNLFNSKLVVVNLKEVQKSPPKPKDPVKKPISNSEPEVDEPNEPEEPQTTIPPQSNPSILKPTTKTSQTTSTAKPTRKRRNPPLTPYKPPSTQNSPSTTTTTDVKVAAITKPTITLNPPPLTIDTKVSTVSNPLPKVVEEEEAAPTLLDMGLDDVRDLLEAAKEPAQKEELKATFKKTLETLKNDPEMMGALKNSLNPVLTPVVAKNPELSKQTYLFIREFLANSLPQLAPFFDEVYLDEQNSALLNSLVAFMVYGAEKELRADTLIEREEDLKDLIKTGMEHLIGETVTVDEAPFWINLLINFIAPSDLAAFKTKLNEKYKENEALSAIIARIQTPQDPGVISPAKNWFGSAVGGFIDNAVGAASSALTTLTGFYAVRVVTDMIGATASAAMNMWVRKGIVNLLEYDNPAVTKIKASRYQGLIKTIDSPGNEIALPEFKKALEQAKVCAANPANEEGFSPVYLHNLRNAYKNFLAAFRNAITDSEKGLLSDSAKAFVNQQAFNLYTLNQMGEMNNRLLSLLSNNKKPMETKGLLGQLKEIAEEVKKAPAEVTTSLVNILAKSAKDQVFFQPLDSGNPPQVLQTLNIGAFRFDIIGMGSPTIPTSIKPPVSEIDPIFKGYLRHLMTLPAKHLYFSYQDLEGAESSRSKKIMALQNVEEFKDVFAAITISKNTDFFKGTDPVVLTSSFCEKLHLQFFGDATSQCFIPEKLKEDGLEALSQELIQGIKDLFSLHDDQNLTSGQKRAFKDLYDTLMQLALISRSGAQKVSFVCRDGIDRAMMTLALFLLVIVLSNDQAADKKKAFSILSEVLFTRAYWVRKRAMIPEREERFFESANTLNDIVQTKRVEFSDLVLMALGEEACELKIGGDLIKRTLPYKPEKKDV